MPIADQTFVERPPLYHAHQFAAGDHLDDLNDWAIGLFHPLYDNDRSPAFRQDSTGAVTVAKSGMAVPEGFWIVLSSNGSITLQAPAAFEAGFAPEV